MDDLEKRRRLNELNKAGLRGQLVNWATPPDALLPYLLKVDTLFNTQIREIGEHHVLMCAPPNGEAGWALTTAQAEQFIELMRVQLEEAKRRNG